LLAACATGPGDKADPMAKKRSLDAEASATLTKLYEAADGSRELVRKSYGALIFPSVLAGGLVVGAEYGEGVLQSKGRTIDYY
jgi:lipid-binding SYLF domain-containing protein